MIIGFTGAQGGMNASQYKQVSEFIQVFAPTEVHHGDCIGVDTDFHNICANKAKIIIHPPSNNSKRSYCKGGSVLCQKPYLQRNKDIVDSSDILFACPISKEILRSGTWSTIRYAKKCNKIIIIFHPDSIERIGI